MTCQTTWNIVTATVRKKLEILPKGKVSAWFNLKNMVPDLIFIQPILINFELILLQYRLTYTLSLPSTETQAVSEVAIPMFPRNPKWVEFSPPVRLHVKYDIDDKDPLRALLAKLPDYSDSQLTISQCIHIVGQRKGK